MYFHYGSLHWGAEAEAAFITYYLNTFKDGTDHISALNKRANFEMPWFIKYK